MTTREIKEYARAKLNELGLTSWRFEFSNTKRQIGVCEYRSKTIKLSQRWAEVLEDAEIKDVILHEIAHALTPHDPPHGKAWQAVCRRIGAKPERVWRGKSLIPPSYVAVVGGEITQEFHRKPSQKIISAFQRGKRWYTGYKGHPVKIMSYEEYQADFGNQTLPDAGSDAG